MNACKGGILRWAVNTSSWNPSRTEWVSAMRLVGSDEERTRINRFVFKKDAKHALVGRLLIRKVCAYFIGSAGQLFANTNNNCSSSPEDEPKSEGNLQLKIARSEKGKPILLQSKCVY